ncbi:MAG: type II secretion system minor pseudopilin GspI [Pseudomonadota bacterium]
MNRARAGFTLIEVLVALAIVAVALSAGIKAAGALTNNAQRLADVSAAQWCADNQLAELKLMRNTPGVGDLEFSCDQLGRRYAGRLVVRPTPNPNFRRVDAVMADEAGVPLLTLSTVLPTRPS